ncbi:unnamed protein product [Notodromas monacha]|uniref:Uncharacterized protein n=1 Tax=Notodromas monacha TaxID=399045 RepID=A0A7R9G955_9CRUS|nr:unnamed protein product [Notodromas monacha]CAG0913956.1 unnamed protein product [Notodromas monacha]
MDWIRTLFCVGSESADPSSSPPPPPGQPELDSLLIPPDRIKSGGSLVNFWRSRVGHDPIDATREPRHIRLGYPRHFDESPAVIIPAKHVASSDDGVRHRNKPHPLQDFDDFCGVKEASPTGNFKSPDDMTFISHAEGGAGIAETEIALENEEFGEEEGGGEGYGEGEGDDDLFKKPKIIGFTIDDALEYIGFGSYQLLLTLVAGLGWMAAGMVTVMVTILNPSLQCAWHIAAWKQAVLAVSLFAGMGSSGFFWGYMADRFGRRRTLMAASWLLFYECVLCTFTPSYVWILFLRWMVGFSLGCMPQNNTLCRGDAKIPQRTMRHHSSGFLGPRMFGGDLYWDLLCTITLEKPSVLYFTGSFSVCLDYWRNKTWASFGLKCPVDQHAGTLLTLITMNYTKEVTDSKIQTTAFPTHIRSVAMGLSMAYPVDPRCPVDNTELIQNMTNPCRPQPPKDPCDVSPVGGKTGRMELLALRMPLPVPGFATGVAPAWFPSDTGLSSLEPVGGATGTTFINCSISIGLRGWGELEVQGLGGVFLSIQPINRREIQGILGSQYPQKEKPLLEKKGNGMVVVMASDAPAPAPATLACLRYNMRQQTSMVGKSCPPAEAMSRVLIPPGIPFMSVTHTHLGNSW